MAAICATLSPEQVLAKVSNHPNPTPALFNFHGELE